MSASADDATTTMTALVEQLGSSAGPCERVVKVFHGPISGTGTADSIETRAIHAEAMRAIDELRTSWGPTADPDLVTDLVPGRVSSDEDREFDSLFALFRRPGIWGYVRLRELTAESHDHAHLRLILGVVRAQPVAM